MKDERRATNKTEIFGPVGNNSATSTWVCSWPGLQNTLITSLQRSKPHTQRVSWYDIKQSGMGQIELFDI